MPVLKIFQALGPHNNLQGLAWPKSPPYPTPRSPPLAWFAFVHSVPAAPADSCCLSDVPDLLLPQGFCTAVPSDQNASLHTLYNSFHWLVKLAFSYWGLLDHPSLSWDHTCLTQCTLFSCLILCWLPSYIWSNFNICTICSHHLAQQYKLGKRFMLTTCLQHLLKP